MKRRFLRLARSLAGISLIAGCSFNLAGAKIGEGANIGSDNKVSTGPINASNNGNNNANTNGSNNGSGAPDHTQPANPLPQDYLVSGQLKYDFGMKGDCCPGGPAPSPPTNKVYAIAGASVSLAVERGPGEGPDPTTLPSLQTIPATFSIYALGTAPAASDSALAADGTAMKALDVDPASASAGSATPSVAVGGSLVVDTAGNATWIPTVGNWTVYADLGNGQSFAQDVYVGNLSPTSKITFATDQGPGSTPVSTLLPGPLATFFSQVVANGASKVSHQAFPDILASLALADGSSVPLNLTDFNLSASPSVLTYASGAGFGVTSAVPRAITVSAIPLMDPTRSVSGTLYTGVSSLAIGPSDVTLNQSNFNTTAQLGVTIQANHGPSFITSSATCPGCPPPPLPQGIFNWDTSNHSFATVDADGNLNVTTDSATGDFSISVSLASDPTITATASGHVTNNGGIVIGIQ